MFEDFEVKPMFEDQFHERHQFKVTINGNDYLGIMHDGEINWFNPSPHHELKKEHLEAVESRVQDMFNFEKVEVKSMFEDQFHERHQFKVTINGNDYMGIMHNGEIDWFNPSPFHELGKEHLKALETQMQELFSFENLEVKSMFEDQFHERHQFKVTINGNDYMGIIHDGEIDWFNPHPCQDLNGAQVEAIESRVQDYLN